jgi:NAD(P)-dependent dehydrogenase (short-subunit alcohol dehydrogenase family)
MDISLHGKSVMISGASQGIGRAIAEAMAGAGADLVLVDRSAMIFETAAAIQAAFAVSVVPILCDVTDPGTLAASLAGIVRVDVLIGNAGIQPITPILDFDPAVDATIRSVLEVNVIGNFNLIRLCLPRMGEGGRIILTASIWGKIGMPHYSAYCASKHAVIGMVRALALELGARGVTVNCVCPGLIDTPGVREQSLVEAAHLGTTLESLFKTAVSQQAVRRLMQPADVAGTYLFLASDLAASITGQALTVDCGGVSA